MSVGHEGNGEGVKEKTAKVKQGAGVREEEATWEETRIPEDPQLLPDRTEAHSAAGGAQG